MSLSYVPAIVPLLSFNCCRSPTSKLLSCLSVHRLCLAGLYGLNPIRKKPAMVPPVHGFVDTGSCQGSLHSITCVPLQYHRHSLCNPHMAPFYPATTDPSVFLNRLPQVGWVPDASNHATLGLTAQVTGSVQMEAGVGVSMDGRGPNAKL